MGECVLDHLSQRSVVTLALNLEILFRGVVVAIPRNPIIGDDLKPIAKQLISVPALVMWALAVGFASALHPLAIWG